MFQKQFSTWKNTEIIGSTVQLKSTVKGVNIEELENLAKEIAKTI